MRFALNPAELGSP